MFGLLNIDKPPGPTSHDVVACVRRLLPRGLKVGHAGTLDPFAKGVLVLCVGAATRLAQYVAGQSKGYLAEATFAVTSTTGDTEGELTPTGSAAPAAAELRGVLDEFVGEIEQVPPAHSAVHVDGRRAYELARADKDVELSARRVRIDALELLGIHAGRASLRIDCGKGTYVRSLVRDLGRRLGCGAYCSALTRTRIGPFCLDEAVALDQLTGENLPEVLLPALMALADWPTVTLTDEAEVQIRLGRAVPWPTDQLAAVAALDNSGRLVALCRADPASRTLRPNKVFPQCR